jgi:hypothetical protein
MLTAILISSIAFPVLDLRCHHMVSERIRDPHSSDTLFVDWPQWQALERTIRSGDVRSIEPWIHRDGIVLEAHYSLSIEPPETYHNERRATKREFLEGFGYQPASGAAGDMPGLTAPVGWFMGEFASSGKYANKAVCFGNHWKMGSSKAYFRCRQGKLYIWKISFWPGLC